MFVTVVINEQYEIVKHRSPVHGVPRFGTNLRTVDTGIPHTCFWITVLIVERLPVFVGALTGTEIAGTERETLHRATVGIWRVWVAHGTKSLHRNMKYGAPHRSRTCMTKVSGV